MKAHLRHLTHCLLFALGLTSLATPASAVVWGGGSMSVTVTFVTDSVFEGWAPGPSPWGGTAFINNPVIILRNASGTSVDTSTVSGVSWTIGGTTTASASFSVPAGTYSVDTQAGRRHWLATTSTVTEGREG